MRENRMERDHRREGAQGRSRDRSRTDKSVSRGRDSSRSKKKEKDRERDYGVPGAGTYYVYGEEAGPSTPRRKRLSRGTSRETIIRERKTWSDCSETFEPTREKSPDGLLERGIDGYTFIPESQGGVLGRGKFSTVYRVTDTEGVDYALKHTPLHPHHPLIAARLLREPTLLAQIPIHPCLIGVHGSIRTSGHFYLIEQYATSHVPLSSHPTPLKPSRAAYILDQLVSVLRDCLHSGGRVVHRDIKGENILVNVETGEILLLDLGLGTHYSASEPRLTTCCGSPAFHSPEIVHALRYPPGEVTYYGPELDIWCIALTMLSLLLDIRFPLGSTHKSTHVMRERSLDRLQELDELYPPTVPWSRLALPTDLTESEQRVERESWRKVRRAMRDFLEMDGVKRMAYFEAYLIGPQTQERVERHSPPHAGFRDITFIPSDIKYTLPLHLAPDDGGPILLSNHTGLSERKVLSYIKYILRSRGILYHYSGENVLQLVLPHPTPLVGTIAPIPKRPDDKAGSWVSSLFSNKDIPSKRASSVPPLQTRYSPTPKAKDDKKGTEWFLKCYARIEVQRSATRCSAGSRTSSRRGSVDGLSPRVSPVSPISPALPGPLPPVITPLTLSTLTEGVPEPQPRPSPVRAQSVDGRPKPLAARGGRTASTSRVPRRPHPLSRQVSLESKTSTRVASNPAPAQVIITLSDARGYGVLRAALDVRHLQESDTPATSTTATLIEPAEEEERDKEEERGRPRSKEDAKVLVLAQDARPAKKASISPAQRNGRPRSRGRKKGFLEGWFGLGAGREDNLRSASSPPSAASPIELGA